MPYKGGDLDLRSAGPAVAREVPEIAARGFDDALRRPDAGGAHSIAVDELVVTCCNHAYDVATFHAAGEVRLEHLLHAMTRVAPAVQALTDIGIRADLLRRETAVAIAAELPAASIASEGAPRASAALVDALRRAADHAGRRLQPVSVHDMIRALLGGGPESPAAALLMRAAVDPLRLERWRDEPRREALVSTTPSAGPARTEVGNLSASVGNALIERLDRMEASMRALHEEVAADRRATADLLRAVQAELQAFRAEGARATAADRGEAVDAVLEAKLGEFGSAMAALAERMGAIDKLAAGDGWKPLGARLEAVEARVAGQTDALTDSLSGVLSERFDRVETRFQPLEEGLERRVALETSIRSQLQAAQEAGEARDHQLADIHEAVAGLSASQQTLADNLATWRIESGGDIGIVSNRLQELEQTTLDRIDLLHAEVQSMRLEHLDEARHSNGFKRWLYGTGSVFSNSWRDEPVSQALERRRDGEKS